MMLRHFPLFSFIFFAVSTSWLSAESSRSYIEADDYDYDDDYDQDDDVIILEEDVDDQEPHN
jgi:hypothetical protein